jgi:hypothetical protein
MNQTTRRSIFPLLLLLVSPSVLGQSKPDGTIVEEAPIACHQRYA